jgi:hypothetical protein
VSFEGLCKPMGVGIKQVPISLLGSFSLGFVEINWEIK